MRCAILASLLLLHATPLPAAQPPDSVWPLWNGVESAAQYAQRVHLPPSVTLDLGNNVTLELVLIPAGQFIMGAPKPAEPSEGAYVGSAILLLGAACALGLLAVVAVRAISGRQRPKFSLRRLLALTFAASLASYGGVRSHKAAKAWAEYPSALKRYMALPLGERPGHAVTLTKPFYMGKFAVTRGQYSQVRQGSPSVDPSVNPERPENSVSWNDAQEFCIEVSALTQRNVRLPTEAEWEYSCRAGTRTPYYSGSTDADLDRIAWHAANAAGFGGPHPVGMKAPNAFGLYDMFGNVWQWCGDYYGQNYYSASPMEDPQGPVSGSNRVMRGGSWEDEPRFCSAAYRECAIPNGRNNDFGFRIVVDALPQH